MPSVARRRANGSEPRNGRTPYHDPEVDRSWIVERIHIYIYVYVCIYRVVIIFYLLQDGCKLNLEVGGVLKPQI